MLKERRHYYKKQQRTTNNDSRLKLINSLKKKRDLLAHTLEEHGVFSLATEDEREKLKQLNKIRGSLKRLGKREDFTEQREKYNLFRGLLYWDISTDYAPRHWKVKNELNQVDKALNETTERLKSLRHASTNAPGSFAGFKIRIKNKKQELDKLLKKITRLVSLQEKHLEKQAIASLQQRYRQIENYHIRARYSLARLYDRLTSPASNHNKENNNMGDKI